MISFWRTKKPGFLKSHNNGLAEADIEKLKSLRVGDVLCVALNQHKKHDKSPDFFLNVLNNAKGAVAQPPRVNNAPDQNQPGLDEEF